MSYEKTLDKESIYELQKIDCNCNDCIFMKRDLIKFKRWEEWNRTLQQQEFNAQKAKEMEDALNMPTQKEIDIMTKKVNKMNFQFDRNKLLMYGDCSRFEQPISFIPAICQMHTQHCFAHRKSVNAD